MPWVKVKDAFPAALGGMLLHAAPACKNKSPFENYSKNRPLVITKKKMYILDKNNALSL